MPTSPILSAEALAWSPRGREILRCVDLAVLPRETVAIVGRNGAGKSSLLRCLGRVQRPTGGRVRLAGTDVWTMAGPAFARRVATVPQETPADFGLTVGEMVALGRLPHRRSAFGLDEADHAAIDVALARVDVGHLKGRDVGTLSGGERQRVMVARALAQQPEVLILDEPTNHLDIRHRLELLALIGTLPITVVTTVHDLDVAAAIADRVVVLEGGRVLAAGAPTDVLTAPVIREAFDVDVRIDRPVSAGSTRFHFSLPA
ncbi:ABC transporter ATP-binding protein [Mongoliimonas terrestris]|uniref:ABC transporter ATP-binding protein n=1 Tax=Mongoliimonas terrestris TaxID=1709001 RepID=UPI000949605B|nr:ABC transporter ATP-binding protein [Mongoliimonas terrestris]